MEMPGGIGSVRTLISCGSFNPLTVMHLRMFEIAKHYLKTKKNIEVVKGIISPTNDNYALIKPSLSTSQHRLAMIRLAIKDAESRWIICDDWETKQKDWVRTLVALRHYQKVYGDNLNLLCGADLLESFLVPNLWSDEHIEEIISCFGLVVVPRSGSNPWKILYESSKSDILKRNLDRIHIIDDSQLTDISSTMVRDAVKEGKPIDHLVHRDVASYIRAKGLYRIQDNETPSNYSFRLAQLAADLLKKNPEDIFSSDEQLCKLQGQVYMLCPNFCCGEFWESNVQFCCDNNFEPTRNLFFFLIIGFVALSITIMMYLSVENFTKYLVMKKLKKLDDIYVLMTNQSTSTDDDDSSSSDSSFGDEISQESIESHLRRRPHKFINKHSQSFKDMSKLRSIKRSVQSKKLERSKKPENVTFKTLKSGR